MLVKIQNKKALRHLLIWILVIGYFATFNGFDISIQLSILFSLLFSLNAMCSYYFLDLFIFQKYLKVRLYLVLGFVISALLFLSIDFLNFKILFPLLNIKSGRVDMEILDFSLRSAVWYSIVLTIAYANMSTKQNFQDSKVLAKSIEKRNNLEMELLKNQFHSHLHLNFFNYCYSKFLKIEKSSAEIVTSYSDFLTYNINNSALKKIELGQEFEYIQNLITLQAQLNPNISHQLNIQNMDYQLKIYPMILGSILENVYQTIAHYNSEIKVNLSTIQNKLNFKIIHTNNDTNTHHKHSILSPQLLDFLKLKHPNHTFQNSIVNNENVIHLIINLYEADTAE